MEENGVHVITVNEYLAKRDYEEISQILNYLGISVGLIYQGMRLDERKKAYQQDVTYGSNTEFGFDYLRDNLARDKRLIVQRKLNYAIVDEADSILLDEANTPMIISNKKANADYDLYKKIDEFVKKLSYTKILKEEAKNKKQYAELEKFDYYVDERSKTANLTSKGIKKIESEFSLENLFDPENIEFLSIVRQILKANGVLKKDVDYIMRNGEIKVIDKFTGRIMERKRFSEGLHEALEVKENLKMGYISETIATITTQNFFKLYNRISGMTGTAFASNKEFNEVYGLDVVKIPTNKPIKRIDMKDRIFTSEEKKFNAVVEEIKISNKNGQPVLIGTYSVEKSEKLCKILDKEKITYELLNAKNNEREAEIIEQSGKKGNVTISTNMAGRGTNIIIGEESAKLGGLKVIGTEKHESSRIDEQLRGRSGRQGEVGQSIFFLSLDDELIRLYGNHKKIERYKKIYNNEIKSKEVKEEFLNAQKKSEDVDYSYRKYMVQFDNVMNEYRLLIYEDRRKVLETENGTIFKKFLDYFCNKIIASDDIYAKSIRDSFKENNEEDLKSQILHRYEDKKQEVGEKKFNFIEKNIQLKVIDQNWIEFIKEMETVLDNINFKAYGGYNPIDEYAVISKKAFDTLCETIKLNIITNVLFGVDYNKCIN